jgi:NADH-ubiquinone oxidoreductase chain 6
MSFQLSAMNTILLDLLALGSVLSGILVITSRNPIISVLFLIAVFVNVACYLILLGINFIGITYLIIYVGAIAILFLFVVMMINIKLAEIQSSNVEQYKSYPLAFIVGTIFLASNIGLNFSSTHSALLRFFDFFNFLPNQSLLQDIYTLSPVPSWDSSFDSLDQVNSLGFVLYSTHCMYLLLAAMVLLLVMVGCVFIARRS